MNFFFKRKSSFCFYPSKLSDNYNVCCSNFCRFLSCFFSGSSSSRSHWNSCSSCHDSYCCSYLCFVFWWSWSWTTVSSWKVRVIITCVPSLLPKNYLSTRHHVRDLWSSRASTMHSLSWHECECQDKLFSFYRAGCAQTSPLFYKKKNSSPN